VSDLYSAKVSEVNQDALYIVITEVCAKLSYAHYTFKTIRI